ncbi:hypothetical protein [Clostridium sp. AF32-12BH]|uniref:hypothetical protein n=1 Tax=Clostridium sp. AF32-12BH TaxID=2292006 RepID=UPI001A9C1D49|nr:hypothetical protein [Clostridium sp. AF32-12BH]
MITAGQKKKTTYGPGTTNKTTQTTQNTPFQAAASPIKNTPFQAAASPGTQNKTESTQENRYLTGYSPSQFQTSSMTDRYLNHLDDLENSKPAAFQSQYSNEIQNILNTIQNRPQFNTDDVFKSDLYTTMREQAIQNGQKSMRDTMGAAQAATGGYGSTYAQAAGQQAYDNAISNFNNTTLDIYDRVYNNYLQEGQELYNKLNMYNNQDSIDYNRYRDNVSDYYNDLNYYAGRYDSSWNQDMTTYQQDQAMQQWAENYAYQKTQDALAQQNWQTQFDYQKEQDALAQQNWQTQFDYQKEQDAKQLALAYSKARSSGGSGSSKKTKSSYTSDDLVNFAKDLLNEKDDRGGRLSKSYYVNDATGVKSILQQYLGVDSDTAAKAVSAAQKDSKNKIDNSYTYRKPR